MNVTFVHTADWQLGKPFAGIDDGHKRALLQNERLAVIQRLAEAARTHRASFVLVAGDLFDSPRATKSTVSSACSALGSIGIPVYAIPGNHDHGGAGSLWEQEFFKRERDQLAPNFHILLRPEPLELENSVLLPCPLLRRHESTDPTAWLRTLTDLEPRFGDKPRIVLAHGTILDFGSTPDDEEPDTGVGVANRIDLSRLPPDSFDYVALGDWHGAKQVGPKAWYPGTPELDRFIKGESHNPGHALIVEAGRGQPPKVQHVRTGNVGWHELELAFSDDTSLARLKEWVDSKVGLRANQDLLWLHLSGTLGIEATRQLDQLIDAWTARLLRVKLDNQTIIAPSQAELDRLTQRAEDPLVARVAAKLVALATAGAEEAAVAHIALRELHTACHAR